ncbi:LamG-like jellyroll fold domain-containing protein [Flavobacterium mekongense]|uniref:LamG-like jellyroll fold domain-containing protein n=1 Tax=Flavobacterium mekongense TaxID=3379707 RepID=UPI003999EB7B
MKKTTPNLRTNFAMLVVCFCTTLTFGQNLYDSNGTIIWDATANSSYNNNVDLIGRDDNAGLNKKQNTDIIPQPMLLIGLGTIAANNATNPNSFATDMNFLVWGDNNGDMSDTDGELTITFNGGSGMTTVVDTPNKSWKIIENGGDIGATRISIPTSSLSGLPALTANDAYVLVIADDESFSVNVETVFLSTSGANQIADYDFDGVKFFTFGVAKQNTGSRQIVFDGSDDYIKFNNVNNLAGSFTMMFWIKPNGQNELTGERTIVSKYDGTSGYRVYLSTDNKLNVIWNGGTLLTSNTAFPNGKWHNVALTFAINKLSLYIDGVLDRSITTTTPAVNNHSFTMGGEYYSKYDIRNYFKGDIDEFRLWNRALGLTQLRFILNQEILQNSSNTKGTILPGTISKNDVSTVKWSSLVAYYSMNSFIGTHIDDDSSNKNRGYLVSQSEVAVELQKAPLPYQSVAGGLWSSATTWSGDASVDAPNSLSIVDNVTPISWNIVKTDHNISSTVNNRVLGLVVANNTYAVTNDTRVEITHYLKLNGKIDLVGRSQLIQIINSDLDPSSSGSLERDQQGQSNKFNYNYWSSPVGAINSSANNQGYTLSNILKDGTTLTPQTLNWTSGVNASATSPITLSKYWIFKFQDFANGTANWSYVGNTGTILPGQGFTLKGSGAATANQNYTFVGKPNNGTITSSVLPNNLNLTGNPYPSAIDANKFIDDNATSITGTLYFWEHYSTNNSHASQDYQGGYATYTKTGGTAPVAPSGISGLGSSSKKPKRYIPVGQGFFVKGSATGGTITYKNSQRSFIKENSASSYTLFRSSTPITNSGNEEDNGDTENQEELFMKIRLGYDSADQYHRETLIGFMNQYGSSNYDNGYDGVSMETLSNDMYFISGSYKLNILADGYFNAINNYPLGVKNATQGNVRFSIDELENTEESLPIYLYDNVTNTHNNLREQAYVVNLPAGTFENRFSLRFSTGAALSTQDNLWNGLQITHAQNTQVVTIKNNALQLNISGVELYNLLGQKINTWSLENQSQEEINLKVNQASSGTYLVKVITNKGNLTKKIVL